MMRAFQLAQLGKFSVAPNPRVGAVIVYKDKIIGEGYHQKYGDAHAEVNAIKEVKDQSLLQESTIYVTLEPCAHFGKTPPCADLLIKHKFKRVVIANTDPFEQVNGGGIKKLKAANIQVDLNCLKEQGREVNQRFFTFHEKKRPYIVLKWAQTQDGFVGRKDDGDGWITTPVSKQLVHQWRAEEDAILVGKNTVLQDDPELTVREVSGKSPIRLVIDKNQELNRNYKVFNDKATTVIFNNSTTKKEQNLEFIISKLGESLINEICSYCYSNNLQSVIIEGGANILKQFITSGVWDEARVFKGVKKFEQGIKAPALEGNLVAVEQILSDKLFLYKNKEQ